MTSSCSLKLIDLGNSVNNCETMKWFNEIAGKIWRFVGPKMFAAVDDILEDTLARAGPKVIKAPRIEKLRIFPP
ncbi:hypothetical protein [Parasitella parasitica]|uniref:Uncharacterized protein n=1 Tax=Parasitella parasitica TaxID=35722 RepID=A0A0B7N552_9FUNG|nr:hypothetical protein [Parasitella parasitica]